MERLHSILNYPDVSAVRINDPFWSPMINKIATVTLPDVWEKYGKDGTKNNFLNIINGTFDRYYGQPWQDGMIYEIIRGASDLFALTGDKSIEASIDEYIDLVVKASDKCDDGYFCTFTLLAKPNHRFGQNGGFLIIQHDLYNAGCLFEAGVHHYKATGKKTLLRVAVRMANYICSEIGYPPKKNIVSAHPMIEQATVQLYRLFKDEPELEKELGASAANYFELAKFWIDFRGNHENRVSYPKYMREYAQDHELLRHQKEAVGHAVRAALVYDGMAAVANETGDEELYDSSIALWNNVKNTKMHVNGGIGSTKDEERFGYQYELPSNAYLETCAAVAFGFWSAELHRAYGQAEMFDVFERSLYNNILASFSEKGTEYTYVNPLVSDGTVGRWVWHTCPCCPPMLLKMMGALRSYIFSYSDKDVYLNLHIGSTLDTDTLKLSYINRELTAEKVPEGTRLHIRIPEYATGFALTINGKKAAFSTENGYAVIAVSSGDKIAVSFDEEIYCETIHPYAWENPYAMIRISGVVTVRRGPFIYCAEAIDNDGSVEFVISEKSGFRLDTDLSIHGTTVEGKDFRLIPYYTWNNRGNCAMKIWLKRENLPYSSDLEGWDNKLYKKLEK